MPVEKVVMINRKLWTALANDQLVRKKEVYGKVF